MRDCRSALDSSAARRAWATSTPTCAAIAPASIDHARGLVGVAAELLLVGHRGKAFAHRFDALLEVLVVEELGIGEARPDHPLVALAHFGRIQRFDVGDADEAFGQAMLVVEHREEFLVALHGRDQRLVAARAGTAARNRRGSPAAIRPGRRLPRPAPRPRARRRRRAARPIRSRRAPRASRSSGSTSTKAWRSASTYNSGAGDPDRLAVMEAVAATHAIGLQAEHFAPRPRPRRAASAASAPGARSWSRDCPSASASGSAAP